MVVSVILWIMWRLLLSYALLFAVQNVESLKNVNDVNFIGRFIIGDTTQKADWSGSAMQFNILSEETEAAVSVNFVNCVGSCKFFIMVEHNCGEYDKYEISEKSSQIYLKFSTQPGDIHTLKFKKVTEVACSDAVGTMEIGDVILNGARYISDSELQSNKLRTCSKAKDYKMLVFGDSVSVTYGIDGTAPCVFTAETENLNDGYVTIVANAVNAELNVVGWSGKGVVRNYGDVSQMSAESLPVLYNRTLGSKPWDMNMGNNGTNYWNPVEYQPDVILILLGSNDYSTQPNPSDEQFVTGLVNFINVLKVDYPASTIAAMCSPSAHGPQCANIEAATKQTDTEYLFLSPALYAGGYGCDGHPNKQSQANMAAVVTPFVKGLLGI